FDAFAPAASGARSSAESRHNLGLYEVIRTERPANEGQIEVRYAAERPIGIDTSNGMAATRKFGDRAPATNTGALGPAFSSPSFSAGCSGIVPGFARCPVAGWRSLELTRGLEDGSRREYVSHAGLGILWLTLNDKDRAFAHFMKACE